MRSGIPGTIVVLLGVVQRFHQSEKILEQKRLVIISLMAWIYSYCYVKTSKG